MSAAEHVVDRTGWRRGPWDREPDKVVWKTASGLPGMIVRQGLGALCGYVAVTKGHPCFGLDYATEHERGEDGEKDYDRPLYNPVHYLDVHGGITYGAACAGHICHVPEPGEPDDVWWLGFDHAHLGDLVPGLGSGGGYYTRIDDVRDEVEALAAQLARMS